MAYDPPKPKTNLGASLAARFGVTSAEKIAKRKKIYPKNKTASSAVTTPMYVALTKLANRRGISAARLIESLLERELTAENIPYIGVQDE